MFLLCNWGLGGAPQVFLFMGVKQDPGPGLLLAKPLLTPQQAAVGVESSVAGVSVIHMSSETQ